MATTGTTLESPPIRQRITFRRTAADTGGQELTLEAALGPGSFIPPHIHRRQQESFDVLSGTPTFWVGRRRVDAGPDDRLVIPAQTAHGVHNRSGNEVRVVATLRPALRAEELFERLFRLGAEGCVNRIGAPRPLVIASLIREFRDEFFYLPWIPVPLQRVLAGARP
jgi:mannose-6-phosphate isomerase-like protein (cupin superfamily)